MSVQAIEGWLFMICLIMKIIKDKNTMKIIITNLIKREIGQKCCFYKTSILHNNNKYRHINQKKRKKK